MEELDSIKARLGGLLAIVSFPETPEERDEAEAEIATDIARLTAAVEAVLRVADAWEEEFPHKAWRVRTAIESALEATP
jgi:hypothetical protein